MYSESQSVEGEAGKRVVTHSGNVDVRSSSVVNSSAYASNGGGGFVAVGESDANNDVNHNNRAYIGVDDGAGNIVADGVVIEAAGHLSVSSESSLDVDIRSNADAR